MPRPPSLVGLLLATLVAGASLPRAAAAPANRVVRTVEDLRRALEAAQPGQRILVASGTYAGGLAVAGIRGTKDAPIVVAAQDPTSPPLFQGGGSGLHLSDAEHLTLEDLAFSGQRGNGLNLDDGGTPDTPAHHLTLRRIRVTDVGPEGNCDGIKLSGLEDFRLEACTVERWGSGGSAVDMVGCHRGRVDGCTFRHTLDSGAGSGVQMKGGTREVTVRHCRFEHAGARAVNAGGSTGAAYFRPPLEGWKGPRYEAKDLMIEGNTFLGSDAAVAFVGVDGAAVRFNTVWRPNRWAFRILQETREAGFVACRDGTVSDNVIAFRGDRWSEGGCNVGPGTDAGTFSFARNVWWCEDAPPRTRALVRLPAAERDGVYGEDPRFADAASGDLRVASDGPAARAGADALPRAR